MSKIKLACVGDTMLGDSFWTLGSGVASQIEKYGDDFLCPGIQKIFKQHDAVFCNVESIVSDIGKKTYSLRSMHMRGNPRSAKRLAKWGITVANVANNHILEHGKTAAIDTVKQLKTAGITVVGAGENSHFDQGIVPKTVHINGKDITFVSLCLRKEKYAYDGGGPLDDFLRVIGKLKQSGNVIIASLHWGNEYHDRPNREQKDIAERVFAAGVKIILGHHAHVIHGFTQQSDTFVAYSLGNFIFAGQHVDTYWSYILSLTIEDSKIQSVEYYPVYIDENLQPRLADGNRKETITSEVERRNGLVKRDIADWESMEEYKNAVNKLIETQRKTLKKNLRAKFKSIRPVYWPQIFLRPVLRRLGLW